MTFPRLNQASSPWKLAIWSSLSLMVAGCVLVLSQTGQAVDPIDPPQPTPTEEAETSPQPTDSAKGNGLSAAETAAAFRSSKDSSEDIVRSGSMEVVWQNASAQIETWANFEDFHGMLEILVTSYSFLAPEDLHSRYNASVHLIESASSGKDWLNLGVLAMAATRYADAESCFKQAIATEEYATNPHVHAFMGLALLKQSHRDEALAAYESAVMLAQHTQNPSLVFRMRHARAQDLFDNGDTETALCLGSESLTSDYPVERLWAVAHAVPYYWSTDNMERVNQYVAELGNLLQTTTAREDISWERGRVVNGEKVYARATGAIAGDPLQRLIMDEECCEFAWQAGDFHFIKDRLAPWVEAHPIAEYSAWNHDLQEWASWVHYSYHAALAQTGDPVRAEQGLRDLIQNVPTTDWPNRISISYSWLGYALLQQQRYQESVEAFETGLMIDVMDVPPDFGLNPTGPEQPVVLGGKMNYRWRPGCVRAYKAALKAVQLTQEGGN